MRGERLPGQAEAGPRGEHAGRSDLTRFWCSCCGEEIDLRKAFEDRFKAWLPPILDVRRAYHICGGQIVTGEAPDPADGALEDFV